MLALVLSSVSSHNLYVDSSNDIKNIVAIMFSLLRSEDYLLPANISYFVDFFFEVCSFCSESDKGYTGFPAAWC